MTIDRTFFLNRNALFNVFGDPAVVRQFETLQETVATSADASTVAVAETQALRDASFVTLSANAELTNERVLAVGPGLGLDASASGQVKLTSNVYSDDGWTVRFTVTGATTLQLPVSGVVATRAGVETFTNKTLNAPKLSGLVSAADDTAAAGAGVPVGGVYRNGSALQVRVS